MIAVLIFSIFVRLAIIIISCVLVYRYKDKLLFVLTIIMSGLSLYQLKILKGFIAQSGQLEEFIRNPVSGLTISEVYGLALNIFFLVILRPLLEREKEFERKIRDSEALFRSLIENASDIIWIIDFHGKIIYASPSVKTVGYSEEEIREKNFFEFLTPSQKQQFLNSPPSTLEIHFYNPQQKKQRILEIKVSPYNPPEFPLHKGFILNARDITENRKLMQEISDISIMEQQKIGHDIHDGLCQQLTGISFWCKVLEDNLRETAPTQLENIQKVCKLTKIANQQARMLSKGLQPIHFEEDGFINALRELVEQTTKLYNCHCILQDNTDQLNIPYDICVQLYRITQEAVNNAGKHADPNFILVSLFGGGEELKLVVRNDGKPFQKSHVKQGMGMNIMSYRAKIIGATLKIDYSEEEGTTVECSYQK